MAPRKTRTRSKLQALVAVFDRFYASVESIPAASLQQLRDHWTTLRKTCSNRQLGIAPSELVAGLEQGLRELPLIIQSIDVAYRKDTITALGEAIDLEYPDFAAKQEARLSTILDRGHIRSLSEYYLVRYSIDLLEGRADSTEKVRELYRILDQYETKQKRRGA